VVSGGVKPLIEVSSGDGIWVSRCQLPLAYPTRGNLDEYPSVAADPAGTDLHGKGSAVLLQLRSPSVLHDLTIRRFHLDPSMRLIRPMETVMSHTVETSTPANTPNPIGPYSHIAKVGPFISVGGTAGVDPVTGELAGPEVYAQARQILESFRVMLRSADSDFGHVIHVNVFLKDMRDFEEMNRAYIEMMGDHRPARTVIGVRELPRAGALLTMNLTAVTRA
jgi:2-iminobutanoate/2-iminopropanoate deaminase